MHTWWKVAVGFKGRDHKHNYIVVLEGSQTSLFRTAKLCLSISL
jgi:hypothetical protein